MASTQLLDPVRILRGPKEAARDGAALFSSGRLQALDQEARRQGSAQGLKAQVMPNALLAPCLVDPHSVLDRSGYGQVETLESLRQIAAAAGFGRIALLPRSTSWRDRPERLQGFYAPESDVLIHLWGSFSCGGNGLELAAHADQLDVGAIGLAEDDYLPPILLVQRGLLLGELGKAPLLLAPRDKDIQGAGIAREGVETLRAGWLPDPTISETLPLSQLLELQQTYPSCTLCLMNLSTAEGVNRLRDARVRPMATVSWWHLVSDSSKLSLTDNGWTVTPSLGCAEDRKALIQGLEEGLLTAVSVHAIPLSEKDVSLPPDRRPSGLAGHHLVLACLWGALIRGKGWPIEQLWQVLSFGPSRLLGCPEERLETNSRRWLLFDPDVIWKPKRGCEGISFAANQPLTDHELTGRVVACGLRG